MKALLYCFLASRTAVDTSDILILKILHFNWFVCVGFSSSKFSMPGDLECLFIYLFSFSVWVTYALYTLPVWKFGEILFFCDYLCPPFHFSFCFFILELKLFRYWLFWIDNFIFSSFLSSFPWLFVLFSERSPQLYLLTHVLNFSRTIIHESFILFHFSYFLPSFLFCKIKFFSVLWKLKLSMIKKISLPVPLFW